MLDGWWVTGWIVLDTPQTAMTTRSPAVLEIPISTSNNSFVVQYSKVSPLLWRWQGGCPQHDQLQVVHVCKSPWLESSWIEFWAQVTWDCSFQTSGSQGQPHVNAGLRSVRQLSAIWLQTKRNCLVSRSARWSYICQVGFYCLNSFWRFKLLIFRILEMFLLWMILYNYIIPLSMYVCLEMCTKNYSKIQKVQNV